MNLYLTSCSPLTFAMAYCIVVPPMTEMAKLHSSGLGVPILFPIDSSGMATIASLHLSITFNLQSHSIWIKQEVYNRATLVLLQTMCECFHTIEKCLRVWSLLLASIGSTNSLNLTMQCSQTLLPPTNYLHSR